MNGGSSLRAAAQCCQRSSATRAFFLERYRAEQLKITFIVVPFINVLSARLHFSSYRYSFTFSFDASTQCKPYSKRASIGLDYSPRHLILCSVAGTLGERLRLDRTTRLLHFSKQTAPTWCRLRT